MNTSILTKHQLTNIAVIIIHSIPKHFYHASRKRDCTNTHRALRMLDFRKSRFHTRRFSPSLCGTFVTEFVYPITGVLTPYTNEIQETFQNVVAIQECVPKIIQFSNGQITPIWYLELTVSKPWLWHSFNGLNNRIFNFDTEYLNPLVFRVLHNMQMKLERQEVMKVINSKRLSCVVEEMETKWIEYKTNETMLNNVNERRTMINAII